MFKGDDEMKKILVLIIGILLGNVGMLLWIILSNSLIELDSNKVVIYSGLLGFSGTIFAILATYYFSTHQLKVQIDNQRINNKVQIERNNIQGILKELTDMIFILDQIETELRMPYSKQRIIRDTEAVVDFFEESEKILTLKKHFSDLSMYALTFLEHQEDRDSDEKNELSKISKFITKIGIANINKYKIEMEYYQKTNEFYRWTILEEDINNLSFLRTILDKNYILFIRKLKSLS